MTDFVDGMHLPTVRALLDLLTVDDCDGGFSYNRPNDYGVVTLRWWSGKGDPRERFAGEKQMGRYHTPTGDEMRPTGVVFLNQKAVRALAKQAAAEQKRRAKAAEKSPKKGLAAR